MLGLLASSPAPRAIPPGVDFLALLAQANGSGDGPVVAPVLILILCVVAGIGTVMLLPSARDASLRKVGGAIVLAAALILVAVLVRYTSRLTADGGATSGGLGVYFWVFSAVALVGAVRVVTHTRPVYSALYFILTVFASAGLFVLLWAEFMAAALVLIYAGAILITYVFVIMLASSTRGATGAHILAEYDAVSREPVIASAVGFTLMGVLLFVIFDRAAGLMPPLDRDPASGRIVERDELVARQLGGTQKLGVYLFTEQAVSLELAGVILTVGMVGAIVIARRRVHTAPSPAGGAAETFSAPMTPIDDDPHSIPVYGTENPRQKAYPET